MFRDETQRNRAAGGVLLLALLGVALGACSSLKVTKVEKETAVTQGGVRYALRSPKWQIRVKETQNGQVPSPADLTTVFEIDADPVYVPDEKHLYEVTLEPGLFTSDSLKVRLDDYGALSRVSATSEPQFAEFVKFSAAVAGILLRGPGVRSAPRVGRQDPSQDDELKRLQKIEEALVKAIAEQAATLAKTPTKEGGESLRILQGELSRVRAQIAERAGALASAKFGQEVTRDVLREPVLCSGRPSPKYLLDTLTALQQNKDLPVLIVARRNDGTAEQEVGECRPWTEVSR